MNVLGVSGSYRERSNSHILLEHALRPFQGTGWGVTLIRLRGLTVRPCDGCDYCKSHDNTCRINDDMRLFYDAFRECDALIVASPVYLPERLLTGYGCVRQILCHRLRASLGG